MTAQMATRLMLRSFKRENRKVSNIILSTKAMLLRRGYYIGNNNVYTLTSVALILRLLYPSISLGASYSGVSSSDSVSPSDVS